MRTASLLGAVVVGCILMSGCAPPRVRSTSRPFTLPLKRLASGLGSVPGSGGGVGVGCDGCGCSGGDSGASGGAGGGVSGMCHLFFITSSLGE